MDTNMLRNQVSEKRQRLQFRYFILSSILLKYEYVSDFVLTVYLDCWSFLIQVKKIAKEQVFRSAADIVTTCISEQVPETSHSLPKPDNLARVANHHRKKLRPDEPKPDNPCFEVSPIPFFVRVHYVVLDAFALKWKFFFLLFLLIISVFITNIEVLV